MSDSKKKDGASIMPASKSSSSKAKDAREIFSKIFHLVSELKNDPAGIGEHEAIVANCDALKKQLNEKDTHSKKQLDEKDQIILKLQKEIDDLKIYKQSLWDDFQKRFADFTIKTNGYSIVQAERDQARKDLLKANGVKRELESCQSELQKLRSDFGFAEEQRRTLNQELDEKKASLKQNAAELGVYQLVQMPLEDVATEIDQLAVNCHQLALQFFRSPVISNVNLEKLRGNLQNATKDFPLSISQTQAARLVRCAAVEHLIVRSMVEHIFTDIHCPGYKQEQRSISMVLDLFGAPGSSLEAEARSLRRRNIVRGQLLAEFPAFDTDQGVQEAVIRNAVDECKGVLDTLLDDRDSQSRFCQELQDLYTKALDIWLPLRRSLERVVAVMAHNEHTDKHEDFDKIKVSEIPGGSQRAQSEVVLQLFPQILADNEVLCNGIALFSGQAAIRCANHEERPPTSPQGAHGQGIVRRLSGAWPQTPSTNGGAVGLTSSRTRRLPRSTQAGTGAGVLTDPRNGN